MWKPCPATGRLSHRFDKKTHRCACGRWQAGFKPKTEPTMPRAECQICERQQALNAGGCLGHHGYKRPGWGFIQGDCMGVGYKPYPATDALVAYLQVVQSYVARCKGMLAELPYSTSLQHTRSVYVNHKAEKVTVTILKGAEADYRLGLPSFADHLKRAIAKLESEVAYAEKDVTRVEKRIGAANQE